MLVSERESLILRALAERRFVPIAELTEICDASEATVRRDLVRLSDQGRIMRVRGGAQAAGGEESTTGPILHDQPPLHLESIVRGEAKRAIARRAAELCEADDALIIDGGTTTWFLANALRGGERRILTNSFPVAQLLFHHSRNRVIVPGGEIYREQQLIVPPTQDDPALASFAARRMFMSPQGLSRLGVMQSDPLLLQTERQLMSRAEQLIVLADASKFESRGALVLCALERIDVLVTDETVAPEHLEMLHEAGVEVKIAAIASRGQAKSSAR